MDLDSRARSAVRALEETVMSTDLRLSEPPTVRGRTRRPGPVWALAAGAVSAVLLLAGLSMIRPSVVADDLDVATTVTSTTVRVTTTSDAVTTSTSPGPVAADPVTTTSPAPVVTTLPPDTTPPPLTITSPTPGQVFDVRSVTFEGTTEPGARVFAGPYEADVDRDGRWSIVLLLSDGRTTATFRAVDAAGNETTASVTADYAAPVKDAEPAPFVAEQRWRVCDSTPPYEEFSGRGEPGSWVAVVSEFGSGETKVGPGGEWYLKVEFPDIPRNTVILVTAKDQFGRSKVFEFEAIG